VYVYVYAVILVEKKHHNIIANMGLYLFNSVVTYLWTNTWM